ncbi:hypothetical protein BDV32DRAFT_140481 [Aspergillus pseudonomiae]|uniref:Uncharacterized protein n=1 Tax=Aspergillus pseudonomiae TaxID=1506151 RepID=A0A5N6HS14_9EURO|nr:uncharacterized protein BDV37DRAFT_296187 [Aspergillus pseudonomiae]KAB8257292.1 hypothetical protein BDV32DRAFT_140481 [Aspergillus pseudonomiae]KAE8401578.1 hypothetical protein BDV37DRAFT_296187 [Aspergillus pseudonomiae]
MGQYTDTLRKQYIIEALRPSFDWAEDVEEALEQQYERLKSTHSTASSARVGNRSETLGDTDTPISSQLGTDSSRARGQNRLTRYRHGSKGRHGKGKEVEPASEPCIPTVSTSPHVREDHENDLYYSYDYNEEIAQMQTELDEEFMFRNDCMAHDEQRLIHHFNWFGHPMYEPSGTPPAISLLFQLADPKMPKPRDELRVQSIFARALMFIDPVLVELENGLQDLDREGFDLVRWATGRVSKFYTLHGRWKEDWFEWDECRSPDSGFLELYQSRSLACGNGFISLCNIRSRQQWASHKAQLQEQYDKACRLAAQNFYQKRQCRTYKPSLLRQSMNLKDLEWAAGETSALNRQGFMLIDDIKDDRIEPLSDSSIHEQEYDTLSEAFLDDSDEESCDMRCRETDANDRRKGTQQTKTQRFEIHTTADQTYEERPGFITSQHATDSTDTWEALSRTPGGGRKKASLKKTRLERWKYNLSSWKLGLKIKISERRRTLYTKAQNAFGPKEFTRY